MLLPLTLALSTLGQLRQDAADHRHLLDRIEQVESHGGRRAVGDHGLARGSFQCHPAYWSDARAECPELPPYREGATDREANRLAVCAVWRRHRAKTDRERALLHHIGPSFRRVDDKDGYWKKVNIQ